MDSWVTEQLEAVQSADKNTERALMSLESVSLPRPPTYSTFQTLDMLSRVAQGATLLALHSQQGPGASCAGLDQAAATLEAHPKLALLGFKAEPLEGGLAGLEDALKNSNALKPIAGPKGAPPGLGFSFANYVSGLPLVVRASALRTIGGIDNTPVPGPDGQIIDSWMLSTRFWLAGFQVCQAAQGALAECLGHRTERRRRDALHPLLASWIPGMQVCLVHGALMDRPRLRRERRRGFCRVAERKVLPGIGCALEALEPLQASLACPVSYGGPHPSDAAPVPHQCSPL